MNRTALVVVFAAFIVGCATAPAERRERTARNERNPATLGNGVVAGQDIVQFPGPDNISLRGHLKVPSAQIAGKQPAIVFQHGCGGVGNGGKPSPRHQAAIDFAVERGYIALHVDSLTPRGETELCTQRFADRRITQRHRVADAYAALAFLATDPRVDSERIVLWGWSHGGGSVLGAVDPGVRVQSVQKFAAAIAFYPGCTAPAARRARSTDAKITTPTLVLIGEADDWTPAAPCKAWVEAGAARGEPLEIALYAGAYHGFDDPNPAARVRVRKEVPNGVHPGEGVTVGPNPAARVAAMQRVDDFLRQHIPVK